MKTAFEDAYGPISWALMKLKIHYTLIAATRVGRRNNFW